MGRWRVVTSRAAAPRWEAARQWLAAQSAARGGEALVVGASHAAAADFVRAAAAAGGGLFGVHRASLATLAAELAAAPLAARGWAPLGGLGAEAITERAAAAAAGRLERFGPLVGTPGFPRVLGRSLAELRAAGVTPERLAAAAGPGARDLGRLLAAYEEELARRALADEATLLRLAREAAAGPARGVLGLPLLLLDVSLPAGPGSPRAGLVQAVAARAPAVLAAVPAGDEEALACLSELSGGPVEDLDGEGTGAAGGARALSRLDRLRREVFAATSDGAAAETAPEEGSLVFLAAPGEGREAVEIARRARDLAAGGIPFDEMAVLLREPASQQPAVEEALGRAGIPAYFSRGAARPDPAGRALLALLDCAADGLSASRFGEYLSFDQVPSRPPGDAPGPEEGPGDWAPPADDLLVPPPPIASRVGRDDEEGAEPGGPAGGAAAPAVPVVAPRHWERLLVDAAVVGGAGRWRRRLAGLEAELVRRAGAAGDDETARERAVADGARLAALRAFCLPLLDALAALPAAAPWGTWLDHLGVLTRRALRHPARVLACLAALEPLREVGPVGLLEVRRALARRLVGLRSSPPASRYGRLFVGTLEEVRGRSFEVVFLPGLAEGTFPRRAGEDPLLLDADRRSLAAGLALQEDRVRRERLLLRLAAGAARGRLVVSYPSLDLAQGRPRVPSFYALDLLRAAEGRLPPAKEMARRAVATSGSLLGWPAPREPAAAIDEAEFDVAVLEPLLSRPAPPAGAGRYLLEVNPSLARSLRARYARWHRRFHPADGMVATSGEAAAALREHGLTRRAYAPTALEAFAACPYRFFLRGIQRLRPREPPAPLERLDPRTRGSLFHEVQRELLQELMAAGGPAREAAPLAGVLERLEACLARVAARYEEDLAPAIPAVFAAEIEALRLDLRGWVRDLVAARPAWRTRHAELAFGLRPGAQGPAGRDPESRPEPVVVLGAYPLAGRIDLVEEDAAGERLRITDHKTGGAPRERWLCVGGGERLQPVLYALAAEACLGRPVVSGRLSFCTRRGNFEERVVALDEPARAAAAWVLATIDRAVEAGFLPAAPRPGACEPCDYRVVCGPYEELRIARKDPGRLADLARLRQLD